MFCDATEADLAGKGPPVNRLTVSCPWNLLAELWRATTPKKRNAGKMLPQLSHRSWPTMR